MKQALYHFVRTLHLLLNALILPLAAITIRSFNTNLGGLDVWYMVIGCWFFFLIWAIAYLCVEFMYYPADILHALGQTGGLVVSLVVFCLFVKTGWRYAVYVSFYNSFVGLMAGLIGLYVAPLINRKSISHQKLAALPWWGHGIVLALIVLTLAFTYQSGRSLCDEMLRTAGINRMILVGTFAGQAALTAFRWRDLGRTTLSQRQEELNSAYQYPMFIATILSVFATMVVLAAARNHFVHGP